MMRSVTILLYVTACGSVSGTPADASGGVLIEAEAYSMITMPMVYSWTVKVDQAGYSGAGFMQGQPSTGTGCTTGDVLSCAPSMVYSLEIMQPGGYFFHARVLGSTGSDDSIWYGVDGALNPDPLNFGDPPLTWHWKTGDSLPLQAGRHALQIWLREPGARVDVIALTTSSQSP